ncbi:hypothetical protein [Cesiribacter sp. SM1]|uniref:hypothetical protein n=1 Tax=Cesiribacter sp. SM1 TaxID=2861196 RepID=UPI001CD1A6A8|nr:hypothetical protein [Cesiribacter sp. SM1]
MNRFSFSYLTVLVSALIFVATGCKKDDEVSVDPSMSFQGAQGESITVDPGHEVSFNVLTNMPAGFSSLKISKEGGITEEPVLITGSDNQTSHTYSFAFSPSIEEAGETIVFKFEAADKDAREVSKTYSITVNTPVISLYNNVVIGGRFNKHLGHFYSMLDNQVYFYEDAVEHPDRADFMFYYNQHMAFTMTAPSDEYARMVYGDIELEGLDNKTYFARSSADFSAITEPEHIVDAWNNTATEEPKTAIHFIEVGDVIVFKLDPTRGSRYGIAEVVDLFNDPADPKTRKVTLRIKITMEDQNG